MDLPSSITGTYDTLPKTLRKGLMCKVIALHLRHGILQLEWNWKIAQIEAKMWLLMYRWLFLRTNLSTCFVLSPNG
jgi:hypothetical protein